jgi:hypothetical protein
MFFDFLSFQFFSISFESLLSFPISDWDVGFLIIDCEMYWIKKSRCWDDLFWLSVHILRGFGRRSFSIQIMSLTVVYDTVWIENDRRWSLSIFSYISCFIYDVSDRPNPIHPEMPIKVNLDTSTAGLNFIVRDFHRHLTITGWVWPQTAARERGNRVFSQPGLTSFTRPAVTKVSSEKSFGWIVDHRELGNRVRKGANRLLVVSLFWGVKWPMIEWYTPLAFNLRPFNYWKFQSKNAPKRAKKRKKNIKCPISNLPSRNCEISHFPISHRPIRIGVSVLAKRTSWCGFSVTESGPNQRPQLGVEFVVESRVKDKFVRAQIWNAVSQKRFHSLVTSYYKGIVGWMSFVKTPACLSWTMS